MEIRKYCKSDADELMNLLQEEGEEWSCYTDSTVIDAYKNLLESSLTYVGTINNVLCGYSRSLMDGNFYIYVCDLFVEKTKRGNNIGRQLMECIYNDYPNHIVYVMSDVDEYYHKQGYHKEGSIFEVTLKLNE